MNRLGFMCDHLPFQEVKALHDAVLPFDAAAAKLLEPYFEGKGGGESMHQLYMDKVDDRLAKGHNVRAYGWFLLDFLHNAFTGGFEHKYSAAYDAHEQGWITNNQFSSEATKALGEAALVTVVSAATGGVVGEWAQGLAAPLGEGAASVVGGGAGGFASGVSGHFTGDVYEQMLDGKQGFDSTADYMKSGLMGAGMGATLAMMSSLSISSSKYLQASAKRTGDLYAERFPSTTRLLEAAREAGVNNRVYVQAKVSEVLDLIDSHLGGPGGPNAFVLASGADLRSLPPDTQVRVKLGSIEDLNRPAMMKRRMVMVPARTRRRVADRGSMKSPSTSTRSKSLKNHRALYTQTQSTLA